MIFIDGGFDAETGISTAVVHHNGDKYIGTARLHEEDAPKASKFYGCRLAEKRATLAALKAEIKQKRHDCEECRKFVNAVMCYKNFDKTSPSAKAMFRQLNLRIKEVNELINRHNELEKNIEILVRQREIVTNALQKKINNKND